MWKFYNVLRLILFLPWTIYFNFRVLPFKQAVKLPIWFYVRPSFLCCGTVKVDSEHIRPGIVKLGGRISKMNPWKQFRWNNSGTVIFHESIFVADHSFFCIEPNGILELGENVMFNCNAQIFCNNKITIGNDCAFGWNVSIIDEDYHAIVDMVSGKTKKTSAPIAIADHCWIANYCTVLKGSKLPKGSIVSSHSVVKNKFKKENSIYAGNPLTLVDEGYGWQY